MDNLKKTKLFHLVLFIMVAVLILLAIPTEKAYADFSNATWCRISQCGVSLSGVTCLRNIVGNGYENSAEYTFLQEAPQRCQASAQVQTPPSNNTTDNTSVTDYTDITPLPDESDQTQPAQTEIQTQVEPTPIEPTPITTKTTPTPGKGIILNNPFPKLIKKILPTTPKPSVTPVSTKNQKNLSVEENKSLFGESTSQAVVAPTMSEVEKTALNLPTSGTTKSQGVVTVKFPINGVKAGQAVDAVVNDNDSINVPVEKVVAVPTHDLNGATLAISYDATPQTLGAGAPGQPDYPKPDPNQYHVISKFRIDTKRGSTFVPSYETINGQIEATPWKDVFISFIVAAKDLIDPRQTTGYENPTDAAVTVLHWNNSTGKYDELSAEKGLCAKDYHWCRYTVHSPGASPFLIVIKKAQTKPITWVLLVLWLVILIFIYRKWWRPYKKEPRPNFVKYVFLAGIVLFGNGFAWVLCTLFAFYHLNFSMFLILYLSGLSWGLIYGCLTWTFLKLRDRGRKFTF